MREESNRVSCSSRDEKEQKGDDGGCCFVVDRVTNTTEVVYVVVTGTRELAERERGVKDKA